LLAGTAVIVGLFLLDRTLPPQPQRVAGAPAVPALPAAIPDPPAVAPALPQPDER